MGKSSINGGCSVAMFDYQRVTLRGIFQLRLMTQKTGTLFECESSDRRFVEVSPLKMASLILHLGCFPTISGRFNGIINCKW